MLAAEDIEQLIRILQWRGLLRHGGGGGGRRRGPPGPPGPVGPSGPACELALTDPDPLVDNGAVINAAIASLASTTGGTVCLGPGVWVLDTSVQLLPGVSLKGAGFSTVITWRAGHVGTATLTDRSLVVTTPANTVVDVDLYDLTLDGFAADTVGTEHCVRIDEAQRIRLRTLSLLNCTLDAVHVTADPASQQTSEIQIELCFQRGAARDALRVLSCDRLDVTSCNVDSPVRILPSSTQVVSHASFRGIQMQIVGGADDWCVQLVGGESQGPIQDVTFAECDVLTDVALGAQVSGSQINRVLFHGCRFGASVNSAIAPACFQVMTANEVEIHDCRVEALTYFTDGDVLDFTGFGAVSDCEFVGTVNDTGRTTAVIGGGSILFNSNDLVGPIVIGPGANDLVCENNLIDLQNTVVRPAVTIDDSIMVKFSNNRVRGGSVGLSGLNDLVDVDVIDNQFYAFDTVGVDLSTVTSTTRVRVNGNVVQSADISTTYGIRLFDRCVCQENYVEINGTGGAVGGAGIEGADDCVVQDNLVRQGSAQWSYSFPGAPTGYVCSENQGVNVPLSLNLTGVPTRATDNDPIVA